MATLEKKTASAKKANRTTLDDLELPMGKRARLHRLLYEFGPGNGTLMVLPIDQGLEHGPVDFFENPASNDPDYQCQLALQGGYSAIATHVGLAEKYVKRYAGKLPLILKLNGKTGVPPSNAPLSTLTSTVEDAVRLGADAVGYTLYVGSSRQDEDIDQFCQVRQEAERYGMPTIIWAYPRGESMVEKGGIDSLYAIDYAARVACEVGADVVKINYPEFNPEKAAKYPKPYNTLDLSFEDRVRKVVQSAGRTLVIFSGGSKVTEEKLISNVQTAMDCGANGLIFGRNMWQRPLDEALRISKQVSTILKNS
jgi:class I fructose-bisphosphate aldolase